MQQEDIQALFEKHDNEYLEFDRVENKLSRRPDLHAFLMLDALVPGTDDMVSAAEHDTFWLDVDIEDLAKSGITEAQVVDLVRCGVMYDDEFDCLRMLA
jgi:alkylhydroperoxidase family enzyme